MGHEIPCPITLIKRRRHERKLLKQTVTQDPSQLIGRPQKYSVSKQNEGHTWLELRGPKGQYPITNCPSVSFLLSIKSITRPMILGGMRFKKLTKIKAPIPIKYRFFSKLKNQDNFLNRFILFPLFVSCQLLSTRANNSSSAIVPSKGILTQYFYSYEKLE